MMSPTDGRMTQSSASDTRPTLAQMLAAVEATSGDWDDVPHLLHREALEAELAARRAAAPKATDPLMVLVVRYGDLRRAEAVEAEHGSPAESTLIEARAELVREQIAAEADRRERLLRERIAVEIEVAQGLRCPKCKGQRASCTYSAAKVYSRCGCGNTWVSRDQPHLDYNPARIARADTSGATAISS